MSENQSETTERPATVRRYRHKAKGMLVEARESLALRTPETKEVYLLLNGSIEALLQGRQGLSQEAQVQYLNAAGEKVKDNLQSLDEKVEAARASIVAAVDAWAEDIASKGQEVIGVLDEAAAFAEERDFAAHQERKGHSVGTKGFEDPNAPTESVEDDEEYDEEDED